MGRRHVRVCRGALWLCTNVRCGGWLCLRLRRPSPARPFQPPTVKSACDGPFGGGEVERLRPRDEARRLGTDHVDPLLVVAGVVARPERVSVEFPARRAAAGLRGAGDALCVPAVFAWGT